MDGKIDEILEKLWAIKTDDKFYFMTYGKEWIKDLALNKPDNSLKIDKDDVVKSGCNHHHVSGGFFGGNKYIVRCSECEEEIKYFCTCKEPVFDNPLIQICSNCNGCTIF